MQIGDYIVPKKTNEILKIEEIEIILGDTILYTCCRKYGSECTGRGT